MHAPAFFAQFAGSFANELARLGLIELDSTQFADLDHILHLWDQLFPADHEHPPALPDRSDDQPSTAPPDPRSVQTWPLPAQPALDLIEQHQPIVELGAGSGYWAHVLRTRRVAIIATDPDIQTRSLRYPIGAHSPVLRLTGAEATARYPDRTPLIIMPDPQQIWCAQYLFSCPAGRKLLLVAPEIDQIQATPDLASAIEAKPTHHRSWLGAYLSYRVLMERFASLDAGEAASSPGYPHPILLRLWTCVS